MFIKLRPESQITSRHVFRQDNRTAVGLFNSSHKSKDNERMSAVVCVSLRPQEPREGEDGIGRSSQRMDYNNFLKFLQVICILSAAELLCFS